MDWIWYCVFYLFCCRYVAGDLLQDIDKYNNNFNQMITTDYEKLVELRDIGVETFGEVGGVATQVMAQFVKTKWETMDDIHRKASTTLLQGITERSRRIHLNAELLFDMLNIDALEETFDEKIDTPLFSGSMLLRLANKTEKTHAKEQFMKYCTDSNTGPLHTLTNLAMHTVNDCSIPKEANIDYYYRAAFVFQKLEKEFALDQEYRLLKQGLVNYVLFQTDLQAVKEKIERLETDDILFESEVIPKLKSIYETNEIEYRAVCWLEKVFSHSNQKVPDYDKFGVIVMSTLVKLDDMLMSCSGMNETLAYYIPEAKQWTKLIGTHIHLYRNALIRRAWPNGVEKRVKSVLPVTTLSPSKYNATTTAIKHEINLMVNKSTKFHVIITNIMESENYYTNCADKTDCLMVSSADVKAYVFLSKHGMDPNKTEQAEKYYLTCRKAIKRVLKKNAGENPSFIWPLIQATCPKILHHYRHIFFGTGFKSEGLMKIGWSYSGWDSYQHIHKYYEKESSVTGQEYHLYMMMQ